VNEDQVAEQRVRDIRVRMDAKRRDALISELTGALARSTDFEMWHTMYRGRSFGIFPGVVHEPS